MSAAHVRGTLRQRDGATFIEATDGSRQLEPYPIWTGYLSHWRERPVRARLLAQHDYERQLPMPLLWPDTPPRPAPFVALYYNERLVGHVASLFGHLAINVNGRVFNFSHLLNEDEELSEEEFLYRPALGEFSPPPGGGALGPDAAGRPHWNKFGRLFMRSVHELHIEGLEADLLLADLRAEMTAVHAAPPHPRHPDKYSEFRYVTRSCATIVRDVLRRAGLEGVRGMLPREVFLSAAVQLMRRARDGGVRLHMRKLAQLPVPEAPPSRPSPILDPRHWWHVPALQRSVPGAAELLPRLRLTRRAAPAILPGEHGVRRAGKGAAPGVAPRQD